jgi:hypothetical protein
LGSDLIQGKWRAARAHTQNETGYRIPKGSTGSVASSDKAVASAAATKSWPSVDRESLSLAGLQDGHLPCRAQQGAQGGNIACKVAKTWPAIDLKEMILTGKRDGLGARLLSRLHRRQSR